jgi:hypothetical protein
MQFYKDIVNGTQNPTKQSLVRVQARSEQSAEEFCKKE